MAISLDDASPEEWNRVHQMMAESMGMYDDDPVNKPSHYNSGKIETIDYIVDVLGEYDAIHYCHGNILKYLGSRLWNKNNPVQDARKAAWYLEKMITLMEKTKGTSW
jgi:hypothetical protein